MSKVRKKINSPKERKPKQQGATDAKNKPTVTPYEPYRGPVVNATTYNMFKTPLARANAKRREKAYREGKTMYMAKILIPENNGVAEHYAWVEKFVQPQAAAKEETTEIQNSDDNNKSVALEEVSGVQGGQHSVDQSKETGSEDPLPGISG